MGNVKSCVFGPWRALSLGRNNRVTSPVRKIVVASASPIDRPVASDGTSRPSTFPQFPAKENPTDVELLYEISALDLKVHKHLSSHLARDILTDAMWATIPHAQNGRSNKVLLVDRHHHSFSKREKSALYQELKHHVHLATQFCQSVQRDPAFIARMKYAPRVQELQHPHIVRLYGYFIHNHTLHVLTEFCQHGNLTCVLQHDELYELKRGQRLPIFHGQRALKEIARQICSAVAFMHNSQLAHVRLNLENVFVSDSGHMMVGDFKDAVFLGTAAKNHEPPAKVQHLLAAPECFIDGDDAKDVDLLKSDAWSVGAVIFAIVTRQRLFKVASPHDPDFVKFKQLGFSAYYEVWKTEESNRQGESLCIPNDICTLLCELLQVSPSKRSTIIDVTTRFDWLSGDSVLVDFDTTMWKI